LAAGYIVLSGFAAPTYEDAGKLQFSDAIAPNAASMLRDLLPVPFRKRLAKSRPWC